MPGKRGRPSKYTEKTGQKICDAIMEGRSLRQICGRDGFPSATTVFRWLADPNCREFREHYARAREAQAERMVDELLEIADNSASDFNVRRRASTTTGRFNREHVQRSKLRIETRKWILSKLLPKKYGTTVEVEAPPERPPIEVRDDMSMQEAQEAYKRLLEKSRR